MTRVWKASLGVCKRFGKVRGIGHRRLAGEPLTQVDSGLSVHEPLPFEERNSVGRAHRDDRVRLERRQRGRRDRRCRTARRSRAPAAARSGGRARSGRPAERVRRPGQRGADQPEDADGPSLELVVAVDPRRAGAARRPASSCPTATGGRRSSSVRAISCSPSRGARKNPPRSLVPEELDREPREPARLLAASAARRSRRAARSRPFATLA